MHLASALSGVAVRGQTLSETFYSCRMRRRVMTVDKISRVYESHTIVIFIIIYEELQQNNHGKLTGIHGLIGCYLHYN